MNDSRSATKRYGTIAWGAFFIWLGVDALLRLPNGAGLLGAGLILIGLNAARYFTGRRVSGFTVALGVIALAVGANDLLRALNVTAIDLPWFPIVLIALGAVWLAQGILRK